VDCILVQSEGGDALVDGADADGCVMARVCYFFDDVAVAGGDPTGSDSSEGVGFTH